MGNTDLLFQSATELAAMVRAGEVSSRELTELAYESIDAKNGELNALFALDPDKAFATADAIEKGDERPFAGVPIAIKDIGVMLAGYPYTSGSDLYGDFTPDFDSAVVRRIKDAGFVIVGKSTTPELGLTPFTKSRRYGATTNPWDTARTPGGSSGGAASAVAGGMLPIAHGSDGGGSIRIPAAACGLVGHKASRGLISNAPLLGDHMLVTEGCVSRTVEDSARMLDVLAGYELGDATWAPAPAEPFAEAAKRDPGKLRIGIVLESPIGGDCDPLCMQAVHDAAALLESLGHEVEESTITWNGQALLGQFTIIWGAMAALVANFGCTLSGNQITPETALPLTRGLAEQGQTVLALDAIGAETTIQAMCRALITDMSQYDVVLTPALAQRPPLNADIDIENEDWYGEFAAGAAFTPYCAFANLSGLPATAVPMGLGSDGLPLSVQLIGRPVGDATLLALANQIEQAQPWAQLRPPS
ncbi:MAG: amidase [Thermoleophilaceae bacterium]|nr:amidase [Thermoleophilaceae bacterium]